jgi:hypothetical protein
MSRNVTCLVATEWLEVLRENGEINAGGRSDSLKEMIDLGNSFMAFV